MKLTKSKLKKIIKEELLGEQQMSLRSMFYELGDKIENMGWMLKKYQPIRGDNVIERAYKQMKRLHDGLHKHLTRTYKDWD
jgi:hypothetical protein